MFFRVLLNSCSSCEAEVGLKVGLRGGMWAGVQRNWDGDLWELLAGLSLGLLAGS